MLTRINNFKKNGYTEDLCQRWFRQLISAVWYCHEVANIFHRDIKPDNILLDENDNIKLSDFGVSDINLKNCALFDNAGSDAYFCPESVKKKTAYNGQSADLWACAVTLYQLVFGKLPFEGKN